MSDPARGGIHYPLGGRGRELQPRPALAPTSKTSVDYGRLGGDLLDLRGVGKANRARLGRMGLQTVGDLLLHLPFRHEPPSEIGTIASLREGEEAVVRVRISSVASRETVRRRVRVLEALVSDSTGSMSAVWYNQPYLEPLFRERPEVLLKGTLTRHRGAPVFLVKRHEILDDTGESRHILGLIPVYPSTSELSVRALRNFVHEAMPAAGTLVDPLPARLLGKRGYPGKAEAVYSSHFPETATEARKARERLAFEELLLLQLAILGRRSTQDECRVAVPFVGDAGALTRRYVEGLPYEPTRAQKRVVAEIEADLRRGVPMRRLLHGDVGSGKTMVATYTMLRALEEQGQAVLMAPTEVLADQHFLELSRRLSSVGVAVGLLKGSLSPGDKKRVKAAIESGEPGIVVGTHALIQEGVAFPDLRVAVVDEQHRFGVRQRDAVLAPDGRGRWPHALHMSATPIPRTLSLTLYGDLDVSTLDEMPPGRLPVTTRLVFGGSEGKMWEFVRRRLEEGCQAYVVCPLIEESEASEAASAVATHDRLARGELAGYNLALLHGALRPSEKADAMGRFAAGEVHVLVSTTVVEVGIDVANATVMVIMGARRFGLSQLHQLRGRVGRGGGRAWCFLVADSADDDVRGRLALFARTGDGFALAEADLRARGEGQLFGERQSGLGDLQVASLLRDRRLLEDARSTAKAILACRRGHGSTAVHRLLMEASEEKFGCRADWVDRV